MQAEITMQVKGVGLTFASSDAQDNHGEILSQRICPMHRKQGHHDDRIEKWNYKRQTYHVPVPPTLTKEYIWILPKRD